ELRVIWMRPRMVVMVVGGERGSRPHCDEAKNNYVRRCRGETPRHRESPLTHRLAHRPYVNLNVGFEPATSTVLDNLPQFASRRPRASFINALPCASLVLPSQDVSRQPGGGKSGCDDCRHLSAIPPPPAAHIV